MSFSSQQALELQATLNGLVYQRFSKSSSVQFAVLAAIFGIATCLHILVLVIRLLRKEERWLVKRIGRGDDQSYWCPNGPLTYNIFAVPFHSFLLAQSIIAYRFGHREGLFPSPVFSHLLPFDMILLFVAGWFLIFSQVYAVCIAYDNSAVRRRLPPRLLNIITYGFPLLALTGLCVVSAYWTKLSIQFFDLVEAIMQPLDQSITSGNAVPATDLAQLYANLNVAGPVGDRFLQNRKNYQYYAIGVVATIMVLYTPFCVSLLRLLSRMIDQQNFLHAGTVHQSSSLSAGHTKRGISSNGRNSGKSRYRYVMYHSIMLYSYLSWSAASAALSAIRNDIPGTVVLVYFWTNAAHGLAIALSFTWDAIRNKVLEQRSSKGPTTPRPALSGVTVEQKIELNIDAADDLEKENGVKIDGAV